ncbi:hypothetical protein P5673_032465, partial [Acropora cervicornis]
GWKLGKKVGHHVVVKSFSGASTSDMKHYLKPTLEKNPQQILLHNPNVVVDNVVELARKIESETNARIILSELVARSDNVSSDSVKTVNRKLKKFCNQNNWKLVQHQNIMTNDLTQSGLHLNNRGNNILFNNFIIGLHDYHRILLSAIQTFAVKVMLKVPDISANPQNHQTKNFLELCNLYQYSQLIQVPTRVTASSSTLIDLFLTNNPCKFSHHGVSHIGISDHSLIYAIRKSFISTAVPTIINSRQLRNFDPTMFRRDLALAPWQSVENITDPNVAWNAWRNMFLNICDSLSSKEGSKFKLSLAYP